MEVRGEIHQRNVSRWKVTKDLHNKYNYNLDVGSLFPCHFSHMLQISPLSGPKLLLAMFWYAVFTSSTPKTWTIFTQLPQSFIRSFHAWLCRLVICAIDNWRRRTASHSGMKNCSKVVGDAEEDAAGFSVTVLVDHLVEDASADDGERLVSPREMLATRREPKWANTRSLRLSFPATSAYNHLFDPWLGAKDDADANVS